MEKRQYLPRFWSEKRFPGYCCESGIAIFAWRDTWNYAYSPFKHIVLGVPENLATFEIEFGSETSTPEGEGEISTPSSDTDTDLPTTKPLVDQQDNIIELG